MITWCVFFFHDSLIVFSFWLLLLHSGLFHYLINWLGGEQTVPQRILLKDCFFFFPLSRIRRYQHTVMNTSLNLVAKFLTTVDLRSETCKEGRYTMISLELQEIFFGGTTRNRKGLQSDFRAKCSGEATHWPLARVGKLWQEVTALLSFERCSIIHFPFSSPFLPPFTPWLSHPLPATSPPSAAGPEATLPVIAVALLSVLPFLIYEFCAVKKPSNPYGGKFPALKRCPRWIASCQSALWDVQCLGSLLPPPPPPPSAPLIASCAGPRADGRGRQYRISEEFWQE